TLTSALYTLSLHDALPISVITGAFVMAGVGAYYLLEDKFVEHGRVFLRVGVIAGLIFCVLQVFPTGDLHGRYMAKYQPVTTAAKIGRAHAELQSPYDLVCR